MRITKFVYSFKGHNLIFDPGILLGNFVPSTGEALQKGQFVGVSAPIGESLIFVQCKIVYTDIFQSCWLASYDVSDPVQSPI